jgi:hypothetical protein
LVEHRSTRNKALVTALLLLAAGAPVGWQVAMVEFDSFELHEDLRDVVAQEGVNIGLNPPKTDDQIRDEVVRAAAEHNIRVQPEEVRSQRIPTATTACMSAIILRWITPLA